MEFQDFFPVWKDLTPSQQKKISENIGIRSVPKGTVLHNGSQDCTGLLLIRTGQLRAYILSDEGRQITLYRLFDRDLCLFSASCIMRSIQFDIVIEAEKDTEFWIIPAEIYKSVMEESAPAANFTNEIMADRFSEVMWLIEQILWKSFDKRLAAFLLDETEKAHSDTLKMTHEQIAKYMGSAREVVSRMLKYFANEGYVSLFRGGIRIINKEKLRALLMPAVS